MRSVDEILEYVELRDDLRTIEHSLQKAKEELQTGLKELDFLLKESAATLFGHARGPNHKERVSVNSKSIDVAHEKIEKCEKALFQFKLRHGEN